MLTRGLTVAVLVLLTPVSRGSLHAVPQPADQATTVLEGLRTALGGNALDTATTLSAEAKVRRQMGPQQSEGDLRLTLGLPDRMHRFEGIELPGGASVERTTAVAGETSWEQSENRGGMGGPMVMMRRGPNGETLDETRVEAARTQRLKSELQRWRVALLPSADSALVAVGTAEAPDGGKADVLETKDARGQPMRLFVDQKTRLPLMLTYQDVRPRMMMGRSGAGGAGRAGEAGQAGGTSEAGAPGRPSGPGGSDRPGPPGQPAAGRPAGPPPPTAVSLFLSDYRNVDGLMLPHQISLSADGQPFEELTVERWRVNQKLKADLFDKKQND